MWKFLGTTEFLGSFFTEKCFLRHPNGVWKWSKEIYNESVNKNAHVEIFFLKNSSNDIQLHPPLSSCGGEIGDNSEIINRNSLRIFIKIIIFYTLYYFLFLLTFQIYNEIKYLIFTFLQ